MNVGRYRLVAQRGAGPDGVSYRARPAGADTPVEVRVLGAAWADTDRRPLLSRRLHLAALLDHPAALRVEEFAPRHDPPYAALEWSEPPGPGDGLAGRVPLPASEAVALAHDLAGALAAAHRLGLVHGRLGPGRLRTTPASRRKLDFTGVEAEGPADPAPRAEADDFCRAPEPAAEGVLAAAADVYALGALLSWMLTGQAPGRPAGPEAPTQVLSGLRQLDPGVAADLDRLLQAVLAADPAERPAAREVESSLAVVLALLAGTRVIEAPPTPDDAGGPAGPGETCAAPPPADRTSREQRGRVRLLERLGQGTPPRDPVAERQQLGRFRLLEKLGQGGMGTVYRAEDLADGSVVAVKVLRADWAGRPEALRRFHKEARLLAEVNNPHVTNLLEVNEDAGVHYLVMEFVAGTNLAKVLSERGRLDEPEALAVLADVARALVDAHARGIVHRDVKPENILLVSGGVVSGEWSQPPLTTHHSPPTTPPR
jgi:serine/threonine protein kinase